MGISDQERAERSFTNTGMSFHNPLRFLFATVIHCGWYRKACTASSASSFCDVAQQLLAARSCGRAAFLILVVQVVELGRLVAPVVVGLGEVAQVKRLHVRNDGQVVVLVAVGTR